MRIGIIGSSWIAQQFVNACNELSNLYICGVCSTNIENVKRFADKNEIGFYSTNYEEILDSKPDIVYIASPNNLHYKHTLYFLKNKVHVLCEKPIACDFNLVKSMIAESQKNKVIFAEAMFPLYTPNYQILQNKISEIGKLRSMKIFIEQYSSRYDSYRNGELPNVFNPKYHAGSLMDLGVYGVCLMVALFGKPSSFKGYSVMLESGVDASGSILFKYSDFIVNLGHSKINDSSMKNEIAGEDGRIVFDSISMLDEMIFINNEGNERLTGENNRLSMKYQILELLDTISKGAIEMPSYNHSKILEVHKLLDEIRKDQEIRFEV